jgi:uncharacterized membrane protein SpoIIM required for sporulation
MPYCTNCGIRLPEDEEARFCPNCGAPILHEAHRHAEAEKKEWKRQKVATRKNRILLFLAVLVLCVAVTSAGALSKVDSSQAQSILSSLEEMEEMLRKAGVRLIFGNNMMYCLLMFTPFVGPIGGLYILYSTGKVLAAMSYVQGGDPILLLLNLLIYPHAWLEYISYSLAISEGMLLSYYAVKHRLKGLRAEIGRTAIYISACAVLLLLGALAEAALLKLALY